LNYLKYLALLLSALGVLALASGCGPLDDDIVDIPSFLCGPQNCSGCCLDNVCYSGSLETTCGVGGATCKVCKADERCAPHQDGACVSTLSPVYRWSVRAESAEIAAVVPRSGLGWDADGSPPDVVVELLCPTDGEYIRATTPEVSSFTPSWTHDGCVTTASALLERPMHISMIDVDFLFNDEIGSISHLLTQEELKAGRVTVRMPQDAASLTLRLTPLGL
jgi:hypothetical protein